MVVFETPVFAVPAVVGEFNALVEIDRWKPDTISPLEPVGGFLNL